MNVGWLTSASDEQAVVLFRHAVEAFDSDPLIHLASVCICSRQQSPYAGQLSSVAQERDVPFHWVDAAPFLDSREFEKGVLDGDEHWRAALEHELVHALAVHDFDFLMLAGYMLIAGPILRSAYRMLNLHPALPGGPKGTRGDVIRQILVERPSHIGAMVHVVTAELDAGPPVADSRVSLDEVLAGVGTSELDDSPTAFNVVERAILSIEPDLVTRAIRAVAAAHGSSLWSANGSN
ncbi:MAG: hypothetical protein M3256_07400 [Actinomycetota bacterium]|nr:hypothetical protein [Actinomycetota bacterium]